MRLFVFTFLWALAGSAWAQTDPTIISDDDSLEIELQIGDSMEIGNCSGAFYTHLDYFRKTRWEGGEKPYDSATGHGFYESFFTTGDFNAIELSSDFKGKRFAIMGMEVLVNKNTGLDMAVMYLNGPDPNSVIWVDFNEALEKGEIGLPGQEFLPK